MHTTSMHVKHPGLGMADTPHHPGDTEETYACERTTLPFAGTGKGFKAAPAPSTTRNTSAQGAVQPLMELTGVLECRKIKALTPYHPKAWEDKFRKAGLSEKYSHIITGLRYGFHISLPLINNTQSPPNKDSVVEFAGEFKKNCTKQNTERTLSWSNLKTKHGDPYRPIPILTIFYHSETGTS